VKLLKTVARHEIASAFTSQARNLLGVFAAAKSCEGCGTRYARRSCIRCLDADSTKVRYCDQACQLMHWSHPTASHRVECGSHVAARVVSSAAA